MASGIPVVASDLAVHREICGEAAVYFPRFSAEALAEKILHVALSPETMVQMAVKGRQQSHQFSWKTHVEKILELCASLITPKVAHAGARPVDRLSKNGFHATSE